MITEDYVSFEVAKLLKEKGFDNKCRWVWILDKANDSQDTNGIYKLSAEYFVEGYSFVDNDNIMSVCKDNGWNENSKEVFLCPTLQTAMKWLREEHNIFIEISISIDPNYNYHFNYTILDKKCEYVRRGYVDPDWINWKYEEAVEAALKYTLENLI